ncbi:hypothetical protein EVAR_20977_1 [Eumeta japonica]|uniref:Uncharacterized protein n=1 Tax=Eumeta variegata TaxID=151549 RepID=A0A4C1V656_EUMVA|nr:hypothetical protein EVAR_20977_1 [Eumeta japonica]
MECHECGVGLDRLLYGERQFTTIKWDQKRTLDMSIASGVSPTPRVIGKGPGADGDKQFYERAPSHRFMGSRTGRAACGWR